MATIGVIQIGLSLDAAKFAQGLAEADHSLVGKVASWTPLLIRVGLAASGAGVSMGGIAGAAGLLATIAGPAALIGGVAAVGVAAVGAVRGLSSAVETAMATEVAMANLSKATDLQGPALDNMKVGLQGLSTELSGVSLDSLTDIAITGAKLGIPTAQLLGYTEGIAKLSTAMDDIPAGEIADQVGKINVVFRLGNKGAEQLGSAIDKLADSGVSSAKDILNVTQRISGTAAAAKITAQESVSLAAALLDTGTNAELGATTLQRLIMALNDTKGQAGFARTLGVDVETFAEQVKASPIQALQQFLGTLKKMDAAAQQSAIKGLGIKGIQAAGEIQKLAMVSDTLTTYIGAANSEFITLNQSNQSYAKASATAQAGTVRMNNAFTILSNSVGELLLPFKKFAIWVSTEFAIIATTIVQFPGKAVGAFSGAFAGLFSNPQAGLAKLVTTSAALAAVTPGTAAALSQTTAAAAGLSPIALRAAAAAASISPEAQKLAQDVDDLNEKLQEQIATFGMSSAQAELYKLAQAKATPEILATTVALTSQLEALQAEKRAFDELATEAARVFEATRTPAEQLDSQLAKLADLLDAGAIDFQTFSRAVDEAFASFDKDTGATKKLEDLKSAAEATFNATRTPIEVHQKTMADLEQQKGAGLIDEETFARARVEADVKLEKDSGFDELRKKAEEVTESIQTPMEAFQAKMAELQELKMAGLLSSQDFDKAGLAAAKEALPDTGPKFAGALELGSQDARSAILNFQQGKDNTAKSQLEAAKQQLAVLETIRDELARKELDQAAEDLGLFDIPA